MLGVVHRAVLGEGPPQFRKWFFSAAARHTFPTRLQERAHGRQLYDYLDGSHTALLRRSALGLPRVYNKLPAEVVARGSVKNFQKELQRLVREAAGRGEENWQTFLSPPAAQGPCALRRDTFFQRSRKATSDYMITIIMR